MWDKLWWLGLFIIFCVVFPVVGVIVVALLLAAVMAGSVGR
jgi:hypothetical protein